MKIHYAGSVGGPYGWGIFGLNITRELAKNHDLVRPAGADVVLMPLNNPDLSPRTTAHGKLNLGICFFESPLSPDAATNAAKFDTVFVGSTWCQQRAAEAGIHNTRVLIQGVDSAIFSPQPPRKPDGTFRIFSGGKFEYRKGQDLVIKAFAEFVKREPSAHLVCAWFNPWASLVIDGVRRSELERPTGGYVSQESFFGSLLLANGIPRCHFTVLPRLSQSDLAREMANTDCGLFPNRCEGGTNLVLMEYAALGGRAIVANSYTGHADVREVITSRIHEGDIHDALLDAMHGDTNPVPARFPWSDTAQTILDEIARLTATKPCQAQPL